MKTLSIVIPAHDEARYIGTLLNQSRHPDVLEVSERVSVTQPAR